MFSLEPPLLDVLDVLDGLVAESTPSPPQPAISIAPRETTAASIARIPPPTAKSPWTSESVIGKPRSRHRTAPQAGPGLWRNGGVASPAAGFPFVLPGYDHSGGSKR